MNYENLSPRGIRIREERLPHKTEESIEAIIKRSEMEASIDHLLSDYFMYEEQIDKVTRFLHKTTKERPFSPQQAYFKETTTVDKSGQAQYKLNIAYDAQDGADNSTIIIPKNYRQNVFKEKQASNPTLELTFTSSQITSLKLAGNFPENLGDLTKEDPLQVKNVQSLLQSISPDNSPRRIEMIMDIENRRNPQFAIQYSDSNGQKTRGMYAFSGEENLFTEGTTSGYMQLSSPWENAASYRETLTPDFYLKTMDRLLQLIPKS